MNWQAKNHNHFLYLTGVSLRCTPSSEKYVGLNLTMSRYDIIRARSIKLQRINLLVTITPSIILLFVITKFAWNHLNIFFVYLIWLVGLLVIPLGLRFALECISKKFKAMQNEFYDLRLEINQLKRSVDKVYSKYRKRNKGEQFKKAYALQGKDIVSCEERLAVGMNREKKEIFVTCFIKSGKVLRVTASIGSAFKCSASDNPQYWGGHIDRLSCDEIRQYHNHPISSNHTHPSSIDHKTSKSLKGILGNHKDKLRSFIIYWNEIREWRIIEYDEGNKHWQQYEFDIAAQPINSADPKGRAAD